MSVLAADKERRLVCVPAPVSDNLLFGGYFFAMFATESARQYLKRGDSDALALMFMLGLVVLAFSFVVLELFARVKMRRIRAIRLVSNEKTAPLFAIIERESRAVGLSHRKFPQYFWIPSNYSVGGRVFGGFSSKLVMTGGLSVGLVRGRPEALFVLRHELAHIKNKDTRLYTIVLAALATPIAILTSGDFLTGAISLGLIFLITVFLLRRRELLADAVAMNASESGGEYLGFLGQTADSESTWLHPARAARLNALTNSSPVLKASIFFICLPTLLAWASVTYILWRATWPPSLIHGQDRRVLFFIVLVFPVCSILFELAKDFRRKTPIDIGPSRVKLQTGMEWTALLAAMNGLWWALTATFDGDVLFRSKMTPDLPIWTFFTLGSVAIAAIWFVVAQSLIRHKASARKLAIGWGIASIPAAFARLYIFWEKGADSPLESIGFLMIASAITISLSLIRRKAKANFYEENEPIWSWLAYSGTAVFLMSLIAVTVLLPSWGARQLARREASDVIYQQQPDALQAAQPSGTDRDQQSSGTTPEQQSTTPVTPKRPSVSAAQAQLVSSIQPTRPESAGQSTENSTVVLQVEVGRNGEVETVQPISGPESLTPAAVEAVMKWRYKPLKLNGEQVAFTTTVTLNF